MFDYNLKSLSPQGWLPCTREIFDELTHREDVKAICLELRQLYDHYDEGRLPQSTFQERKGQLKKRLPAFAFHAHFPDGRRANKTALPSGLCMIDIDNLADPHELWADILSHLVEEKRVESRDENLLEDERVESREENGRISAFTEVDGIPLDPSAELAPSANPSAILGTPPKRGEMEGGLHHSPFTIHHSLLLSHVTPSGHGLRLVLRIDDSLRDESPADAIIRMQQLVREWFISVLGKDPGIDLACKDLARISFAVPDSYILYLDDKLFDQPDAGRKFSDDYLKGVAEDLEAEDYIDEEEEAQNSPSLPAVAAANNPSNGPCDDASPLRVGANSRASECHASLLADGRAQPRVSTLAVARTAPQGGAHTNDHAANDDDIRDVPSRRATARVAPTSNGNADTREDLADPQDGAHHSPFTIDLRSSLGCTRDSSSKLGSPLVGTSLHHSPKKDPADSPLSSLVSPLQFKGIPYEDIIRMYWQEMGGEPSMGERNTKLHQLAYHLRYICDFNADLLQKIMPTFGLNDKEMHDLIQSALKAPRYSYSNVMNKVLAKMQLSDKEDSPLSSLVSPLKQDSPLSSLVSPLEADDDPPAMPTDLPPLVELLVSCSPEAYKPAVAHGIFPPLATHLRDVRFRYIDNVEHEATLMCLLMAGSSAGKSCLAMPIRYLMADIRKRDDDNLLREKLWKKECTSLGANQDKPPRPEGLIIQEIDPDITNPAFVQRMKEAEPSPLYACMNEVEQFDNLRSSRGSKAQFQIMCYAFDPGNRYGQTRVGVSSVTEKVCVRFNWNASTTINKGQRYFKSVANDGPLSRINVCTIPPAPIGDQMPVYGIYPDDYAQQLQPYLDNLCRAHGLLLIPEATRFAWRLVDRNAQISSLTQNPVFEHLSFRAAVIAWLKACVLYVAQGNQWDERIEQFCQWSMDYDLWCKMRFFSQAIEEAMRNEVVTPWRKDNLLNMLKDSFTKSDIKQLLRINGCKSSPAKILYIWEHRHFIRQNDDGSYSKILE